MSIVFVQKTLAQSSQDRYLIMATVGQGERNPMKMKILGPVIRLQLIPLDSQPFPPSRHSDTHVSSSPRDALCLVIRNVVIQTCNQNEEKKKPTQHSFRVSFMSALIKPKHNILI